ncbi:MAG: hypothetical protein ACTSUE_23885 [Promethearchaeota archaeon]
MDLDDVKSKLEKINNQSPILEKIKINKEMFGSYLIRRPLYRIDPEKSISFEDVIENNMIKTIITNNGSEPQEIIDENHLKSDEGIPINTKLIDKQVLVEFNTIVLNSSNNGGKFIDSNKNIFDNGEDLIILINSLNLKILNEIIKAYSGKRFFKIVFIEQQELLEFTSKVPSKKENVYEIISFQDFKNQNVMVENTIAN